MFTYFLFLREERERGTEKLNSFVDSVLFEEKKKKKS